MSNALQELEAKLEAAFNTSDWSLDSDSVIGEDALSDVEESSIRPINMDLVPLGGSRPRSN
ncbi:hypothetical protein [Thermoactinospora rubra]|uniref:hypothetical protein n=1 Tax=Thermoactinospora rubra TaxID=1088767 RepID=UPI00117F8ABB|nr:hypothetical protein [Thermoactinospora rubra]